MLRLLGQILCFGCRDRFCACPLGVWACVFGVGLVLSFGFWVCACVADSVLVFLGCCLWGGFCAFGFGVCVLTSSDDSGDNTTLAKHASDVR